MQRRFIAIVVAGGVVLVVLTFAALSRLEGTEAPARLTAETLIPVDAAAVKTSPNERDDTGIDEGVFTARLWNPPPPETKEEPEEDRQPRRTPPPQVELIAITTNGSERIAALFDSRANELRMLRIGDEVQGYAVEAIEEAAVTIVGGRATHRLALFMQGEQSR